MAPAKAFEPSRLAARDNESQRASSYAVVLPDRRAIDPLRTCLVSAGALFEPRLEHAAWEWQRVSGSVPFAWEAPRLPSVKRFFFPPRETLLRWEGEVVEEVPPPEASFALFGIHACDLTAIAYQDRFFARDPWYVRRREHALLVGVNCLAACAGGFCRDIDAGPFARGGFDLNLTPLADGRVVLEVGSTRGDALVRAAGLHAPALDAPTRGAFDAAARAADATFPLRSFIATAIARINATDAERRVSDAEWQALGPACFACTGCSNVCPTCSCFTVVDEVPHGAPTPGADAATVLPAPRGERVRYWDSCLLEGFQREASGHHPAPRPGDRVRRFWYHKLSDDFTREFGRPGCVGCGRCDTTCPGSIGALNVLGKLGGAS